MTKYPGATFIPSVISHPKRDGTRGIVIHWTAGREAGDISTLTRSGNVDVQFYVTKAGKVYQFLDADSQAWHAFHTANHYCIGIEHEGSGEPWTPAQMTASAKLSAWLCARYSIPMAHVYPRSGHWNGLYGHVDLQGIDGNNHTDTVPADPGWERYIFQISGHVVPVTKKQKLIAIVKKMGPVSVWQTLKFITRRGDLPSSKARLIAIVNKMGDGSVQQVIDFIEGKAK